MEKQLAIIEGVGYGNRDVGRPVLWFSTMISKGSGALQVLENHEAGKLIKAYGVYDVKDLEGKPIWVIRENGTITIAGYWED